jgi:biotin transport system substrate-specific component
VSTAQSRLRGMVYASLFGALTALGAYLTIPLPVVPITLQTLFTNLAGALLGGVFGALSQVVYVFLGVIGLPVFAGGKAGLGVLLGPTGGYLIGFVIGALVTGKLVEKSVETKKKPGFLHYAAAMTAGLAVIYACGILQLTAVAKITFAKALAVGVLPFLPGDFIKIAAASLIALKLKDSIRL